MTNFGTMVWSPVTYSRVSWDWLFILDLTLTALALVPQLAAWCYREPRKFKSRGGAVWVALTICSLGAYALAASAGYGFGIGVVAIASLVFGPGAFRPGSAWRRFQLEQGRLVPRGLGGWCAYIWLLASDMHRKALAEVNQLAAQHMLSGHLSALPLPPTLTHWAGLISTPEGVWRTTFREPGGAIERTQFYSDEQSDPYVQEAKKLRDVQVYLWFARFPVWQVTKQGEQIIADVSDVRFYREEDPTPDAASGQAARLRRGAGEPARVHI